MHLLLTRSSTSSASSSSSSTNNLRIRRPLIQSHRQYPLPVIICVTLLGAIALAANLALLYAALNSFLALLRHKCGGNVERWSTKGENGTGTMRQRFSITVRPTSRPPPTTTTSHSHSPIPLSPSTNAHPSSLFSPFHSSSSSPISSSSIELASAQIRPNNVLPIVNNNSSSVIRFSATTKSSKNEWVLPRLRVTAGDLRAERWWTTARLRTTTSTPQRYTVTVVTALLDIGRDRWYQYGRTLHQYHQFMRNLLRLQLPMVIIVDEKSFEFVHKERARIGMGKWTKVKKTSLSQLPLAAFQQQISYIMNSELARWKQHWDPAMRTHPEASHPEYNIVVNSKPYFMAEAAADNPFQTEFFAWLDAGYGHGERAIFPAQWQWNPTFVRGKISLIKLTPPSDKVDRYRLRSLYRQDVAVLSGGFFAGDRHAVNRLYKLHRRRFLSLLESKMVDDDQTMLVLLANDHPNLFDISHGDWFDAFELF